MTKKRFYYAHGIIFDTHKDNHINKIGTIKDLDTGLRIVNWLNELNDENEHLKHQNELLSDELEQCRAVIDKQWSEYLKKKELKMND